MSKRSQRELYIFRIIQQLDRNITGREAVSEMMLFNNPSNSFSFIDIVGIVRILYFHMDMMLTK